MTTLSRSPLDLGVMVSWGFPGGSVVKNWPANAGDMGLIPGKKDSLEIATHSSILVWEIPWTEETGSLGYSPWGHKTVGHRLRD